MNELHANTLLHNRRYAIQKTLGQGGFGITYLAYDNVNRRQVAIKEFFMKELCNRNGKNHHMSVPSTGSRQLVDKFRAKFLKEANTIANLSHPNIIKIYDIFEENDTAYYAMEYISGGSLADLLEKEPEKRFCEVDALHYIRQVAGALNYIHMLGINHLDIKPDNILNDNGRAVLIDFGVAKRYDNDGHQTSTTPVGLSHGYAPLEQYKSGGVAEFSPTTDIYSLGATLYKLITGQTPPDANDVLENGLSDIENMMSTQCADAIKKAMRSKRAYRQQSIDEFLNMLPQEETIEATADDDDVEIVEAEDKLGNTVNLNPGKQKTENKKDTSSTDTNSGSGGGVVIFWILVVIVAGVGIWMANNGSIPSWYKGLAIGLCVSYKGFEKI